MMMSFEFFQISLFIFVILSRWWSSHHREDRVRTPLFISLHLSLADDDDDDVVCIIIARKVRAFVVCILLQSVSNEVFALLFIRYSFDASWEFFVWTALHKLINHHFTTTTTTTTQKRKKRKRKKRELLLRELLKGCFFYIHKTCANRRLTHKEYMIFKTLYSRTLHSPFAGLATSSRRQQQRQQQQQQQQRTSFTARRMMMMMMTRKRTFGKNLTILEDAAKWRSFCCSSYGRANSSNDAWWCRQCCSFLLSGGGSGGLQNHHRYRERRSALNTNTNYCSQNWRSKSNKNEQRRRNQYSSGYHQTRRTTHDASSSPFALHALSYDDDTSSSPSGKEGEEEEDDSDDDDEKGGYYKTKHWNPTKHASNGLSNDDSSSSDDSEHAELKMEKEGGVAQRRTPGALESIEGNVFRDRERLKSDKDFDRVKKTGRTLNYSCIRIKAAPNDGVPGATGCHRIGIVVPKKQLKRAVDRNLCKRRVRAIFRTNKDKWPKTESGSHLDFVVFVKQEALEGGFKQLEKEMFLFASDYTEREMKSKTSKSRNAAKVVRNTNANVTRTAQASNENENVRAKKENGPTNNIARWSVRVCNRI